MRIIVLNVQLKNKIYFTSTNKALVQINLLLSFVKSLHSEHGAIVSSKKKFRNLGHRD